MYSQVQKMQWEIVQATLEGKGWKRVYDLQRQLIRSFAARALAVRRVTTSEGRKTPGRDGVVWITPENRLEAVRQLQGIINRQLEVSSRETPLSVHTEGRNRGDHLEFQP
jgi:hypothetical protein